METLRIYSESTLSPAGDILRRGGMVAVPTETVYGLCVNGLDEAAVADLYEIKGRPEVKPLSLMVSSPAALDSLGRDIPPAARRLAEEFWPGPLTIVVKAAPHIPAIVRAGGGTIGLRCPDHPLTLALLEQTGLPLAGPSANPSGAPSPKTAGAVLDYFDGRIGAVLDGGECGIGRESTIVDVSAAPYRILRHGALEEAAVTAALRRGVAVVGITGGTGCGKTTALNVLRDMGALVLDCDAVYHELLVQNGPMVREILDRFPAAAEEGRLHRKKLGSIVFADPEALLELNAITHRHVNAEVERRLTAHAWNGGTLAAIDAIALLESGLDRLCRFTVGVTAPTEDRVRRIMHRDGISEEYARLRVAAQKDNTYYRSGCTFSLENAGDPERFRSACRELFLSQLKNENK